jgi:hypothetical protein
MRASVVRNVGVIGVVLLMAAACGDDEGAAPSPAGEAGDGGLEAGSGASSGRGAAGGVAGAGAAGRVAAGSGGRAAAAGSGGAAGAGAEGPAAGSGGAAGEPPPDAGVGEDAGEPADAGDPSDPVEPPPSGSFLALTYNVAGLPQGLSSSNPERNMPLIAPLLNGYDLVFLQESWQTPDPNPFEALGVRVYHEVLVAGSEHPFRTVPDDQPFGNDPVRPSALLGDGLNVFSDFPLGETRREAWASCVETASDCLAFKGFSMTPATLADGLPVHIYDLHMEAGESEADVAAREVGIDQMISFIGANSSGTALIVAGDFNLETSTDPDAGQYARFIEAVGLTDSCAAVGCAEPGGIDKVLVRSSEAVELRVESWEEEGDVFVTAAGEPLSDHPPVAVRIAWSGRP